VSHRELTEPLPPPDIVDDTIPLAVTTPLRAMIELETTGNWAMAFPLAPQRTRIVTRQSSQLAGVRGQATARALRGQAIAVADATSAYAARLASAAHRLNLGVEIGASAPPAKDRDANVLYLVTTGLADMVQAFLSEAVDGFATVEPFPTFAEFRLPDAYCEVILNREHTVDSTEFCCCVALPAEIVEDTGLRPIYRAVAGAIVQSSFALLDPKAAQAARLHQILTESVDALNPLTSQRVRESMATVAAARIRAHITELLPRADVGKERGSDLVKLLAPNAPSHGLQADFDAIAKHLPDDIRRQLRLLTGPLRFRDELYPVKAFRDVCSAVVRAHGNLTQEMQQARQAEELAGGTMRKFRRRSH
jgi:ABC-type nitrate/sulfonate/bicarbonate transport system substrate-binding protein